MSASSLLTVREVATLLQVSEDRVYYLLRVGGFVRSPDRWCWLLDESDVCRLRDLHGLVRVVPARGRRKR